MGRLLPEECPHGKIISPGDFDATVEPCEICDSLPWVSVFHKMPARYQMVLGYFPDYEKRYQQETCYWDGKSWQHYNEGTESPPSYWMELFEPPRDSQ